MVWLMLVSLTVHAGVPAREKPPREAGALLYSDNCWSCHGERGLGDGPLSEALPSPALAGRIEAEDMDHHIDQILHGNGDMPAYAPVLTVSEARWILQWLAALDPVTGLDDTVVQPAAENDGDEAADEGPDEQASEEPEVVPEVIPAASDEEEVRP